MPPTIGGVAIGLIPQGPRGGVYFVCFVSSGGVLSETRCDSGKCLKTAVYDMVLRQSISSKGRLVSTVWGCLLCLFRLLWRGIKRNTMSFGKMPQNSRLPMVLLQSTPPKRRDLWTVGGRLLCLLRLLSAGIKRNTM